MSSLSAHSSQQRLGLLLALIAAMLFSTKPILVKWLYEMGITALPLLWLRFAIAMPLYIGVGIWAWRALPQRPSLLSLLYAALIGLLGYYISSWLDLRGLEYVTAQLERLILYSYPTFVLIFGALFLGIPFKRRYVAALFMTYAGLLLVFGEDATLSDNSADITWGTLLVLCSALTFAFYILFSQKGIRELGSLLFTSVAMTSASIAICVHYALVHGFTLPPMMTPTLWWGSIVLAVMATVIPTFLASFAIQRIGPAQTALSGTIGPVVTTLLAVTLLDEPFTWLMGFGMALVVLGVTRLQKIR